MAKKRERIDRLLVERGLAESRAKAQALVLAGEVVAGDQRVDKPGALVAVELPIRLKGEGLRYVSRGALKLEGALDHFGIDVTGFDALDVGASTGGFTDLLLQRGASRVVAVDVGYGQLHPKLRGDARVTVRERVNARALTREDVPFDVDLIVADVSFISLRLVLPSALRFLKPGGAIAVLVKPQFEVGRQDVGKGGVVRDPEKRREAIEGIARFVAEQGLEVSGWIDAPIAGPAGNREAVLYARKALR
ncbi:MAG: TlyA family RNA methyltransferase [Myxococcales bacterium]|jgi:23S rRNA (cytidine1920-2'-O)/16S rRNA (cytidine1409-2'-O)-methyltransferase